MKIQLSPYGKFPKRREDGTTFTQVFDREAAAAVKSLFDREGREKLFDYEHERGKAAGWITGLEIKDDGLYADVRPTPAAAKAVNEEEYIYTSVDWDVDLATGRPTRIHGAALTNIPNMDVVRIKNSKHFDGGESAEPQKQPQPQKQKMKAIAIKLGLAEDADEAAILAAIDALAAKLKETAEARLENEADAFVEKHKARIKNSEEIKKAYKECPNAVKAAFENSAAAADVNVRVTNSKEAKGADEAGGVKSGAASERVQNAKAKYDEWLAMPSGAASERFYNDNKALIDEGSAAAASH